MFHGAMIHAHGGQGAVAGQVAAMPRIEAVFRGTTHTIKVWQGHGAAEEFSVREAQALCVAGDEALMDRHDQCQLPGQAALYAGPGDDGAIRPIIVSRLWLIGFLAAIRRALRVHDTAQALASKPLPACVDADSDPGAWARHLRHTAAMRHSLDASGGDSS